MKRLLIFIVLALCLSSSFAQTTNEATVSMKQYIDMRVDMLEKINQIRDENIRDNVNKANAVMDKRLDGMNEFRQTLKDSNSTYVTWQALIGLIIGVSGFIFGYSNYKKNQQNGSNAGKNIVSGDKVEVKK